MTLATRSTITTFRAETRPVYTKSGTLRIETTVIGIERDILTGRFVSRAQGKFTSQQAVTKFLNQVNTGELTTGKALGILRGRSKLSPRQMVQKALNSLVKMYDMYIPVSDYDKDKLAYMFDKLDWEQFESFYNQNTELVESTYRVGSPRATDKDRNIMIPSEETRNQITSDLIERLQTFLSITDEELDNHVNPTNYTERGVRKQGTKRPAFSRRMFPSV